MEIRDNNEICVLTPLSPTMNKRETEKILTILNKNDKRKIALDLSYVHDCTIEFVEGIISLSGMKNIGIFNISSDIFSLFNIMKVDKKIKLYTSELDWKEDFHRLINRNFKLV